MPLSAAFPIMTTELHVAFNAYTDANIKDANNGGGSSDRNTDILSGDITAAIDKYLNQGQVSGTGIVIMPKLVPSEHFPHLPSTGRGFYVYKSFGTMIPIVGMEMGMIRPGSTISPRHAFQAELTESLKEKRDSGQASGADTAGLIETFATKFAQHIHDYAMKAHIISTVINGPWVSAPAFIGPNTHLPIAVPPGEPGVGTSDIQGIAAPPPPFFPKLGIGEESAKSRIDPLKNHIAAAYMDATEAGKSDVVNEILATELSKAIHDYFFKAVTITAVQYIGFFPALFTMRIFPVPPPPSMPIPWPLTDTPWTFAHMGMSTANLL